MPKCDESINFKICFKGELSIFKLMCSFWLSALNSERSCNSAQTCSKSSIQFFSNLTLMAHFASIFDQCVIVAQFLKRWNPLLIMIIVLSILRESSFTIHSAESCCFFHWCIYVLFLLLFPYDEGLTCHLKVKKSPLKRKSLDHSSDVIFNRGSSFFSNM